MAVVYISRIENGKTINEGICIKCAKELGIKPVDDVIEKMGLTDEDLDRMDMEMEGMMDNGELTPADADNPEASGDNSDESRTPAIDFRKLMGQALMPDFGNRPQGDKDKTKNDKGKEKKDPKRKFLELYCQSLNTKAIDGKLDNIVGRDRELSRVIQILCRRQKNNPCLIGEPGVGKTAIAEALAQRIVAGDVPYKLRGKEVHLVDLTS
ncbi:MAG: ATP-dependent Clp protease ATP-binding subunit, partial [Eubacteriales bacterium]